MTLTQQQEFDRLALAIGWTLGKGSHPPNQDGEACVMEAVAWVAGEPWSDEPQCASPVIGAFMRSWNDALDGEVRNRLLKPLIPQLVGTRASAAIEEKRNYMALDWLIRVFTPKWLDMVPSLHAHAKALRDLEGIADMDGAAAAGVKVRAAWAAAWAAAKDAARDAAGDAAWAAAGAAARAAAGDAAGDAAGAAAWAAARDAAGAAARDAAWAAAWDAARAAAWDAAWDAAWAAAWDAAWDALKPTTEWLQASALDLVQRMIEVKE
jgi:hypothetical protein